MAHPDDTPPEERPGPEGGDAWLAGQLLKEARLTAGLTQAEMARLAGAPQSVVSAYERGRRQPSAEALSRLVQAAGFDLAIARSARRVPRSDPGGRPRDRDESHNRKARQPSGQTGPAGE